MVLFTIGALVVDVLVVIVGLFIFLNPAILQGFRGLRVVFAK